MRLDLIAVCSFMKSVLRAALKMAGEIGVERPDIEWTLPFHL